MLVRLVDVLKNQGVTSLFTNLTQGGANPENTDAGISSIIDTWLLLRHNEQDGQRSAVVYVLKSRGMAHSKRVKRFGLTDAGDRDHGGRATGERTRATRRRRHRERPS